MPFPTVVDPGQSAVVLLIAQPQRELQVLIGGRVCTSAGPDQGAQIHTARRVASQDLEQGLTHRPAWCGELDGRVEPEPLAAAGDSGLAITGATDMSAPRVGMERLTV